MTLRHVLSGLAVASLVLLGAREAAANPSQWETDDWPGTWARYDVGLDSYLWFYRLPAAAQGSNDTVNNTTVFDVFYHRRVANHVFVDFDIPGTFTVASEPITPAMGNVVGGVGNVTLGAHFGRHKGIVVWHAGGALALPFSSISSPTLRLANTNGGAAMAGWNDYFWCVGELPFVGRFGVELRPVSALALRLDFDPMTYIPIMSGATGEVLSQERFEIEGRAAMGLGAGAGVMATTRFNSVSSTLAPPTTTLAATATAPALAALEAWLGYDDGHNFFMRAGGLLALNSPLGPGFQRGGALTGQILLGVHLSPISGSDDD